MTFADIVAKIDGYVWGPVLLILLVGAGLYLGVRVGFIQFTRIGYWMKNTLGKIFKKQTAGEGEVTPLQAVTTALAATVGTGNIVGVTGAIIAGGPGAVFWMWLSALVGMVTKYAEVLLAIKYRERNAEGDWVGGPMYYIKNGLGKNWKWLGGIFCVFGALAALLGIGNMSQINTIATSINGVIDSFGGATGAHTIRIFGADAPISSLIIGVVVAAIVALVLIGGIKRIGAVTEKLVPVMAIIYILAALVVIFGNLGNIGRVFGMIFGAAFTPRAVMGGAVGTTLMITIQKGVGRGVFSNEAGLGSAPIAHAASSESNPVKQGLYGIFEVFMDTIVICTLTSLVVLLGFANGSAGFTWEQDISGAIVVGNSFASIFGAQGGALIVAVGISLFALSTILSWSLYGVRCFEYLFGTKASIIYKVIFVLFVVVGAVLANQVVWDIADILNGLMALPNLIALFALSGVVIKVTKEHFSDKKNLE